MAGEPRLRAVGLGHWHRPGHWLFRHVDIDLPAGRALAVLGPNGRGKSTLLRLLAGIARSREGRVDVAANVAVVPSALAAVFDYDVLDIVLMGRAQRIGLFAQPTAADNRAAASALARFGIGHLAHRAYSTLSSGERQMTLLARALASEAGILVMDEPTAALDLAHRGSIAGWLKRLVREDDLTLVFATHDPNEAFDLAHDVLLMHPSPNHVIGSSEDLLTAPHLSELFRCKLSRFMFENEGQISTIFLHHS